MQSGQYQAEKQAPLSNVDSGDEDHGLNSAGDSHHEGASNPNDPALNLSHGVATASANLQTPPKTYEEQITSDEA
jgi:hypothetical protein